MSGRVLIADDHPLTREGLAMAVRLAVQGATVDYAGSVREGERQIARHGRYRLILLDLLLPDSRGYSGLMTLQFASPSSPIAIITAREDAKLAGMARSLGAVGFLRKSEPLDRLAEQIGQLAEGKAVFPADSPEGRPGTMRDRIGGLTDAQKRVLFALADGQSNKHIASMLELSEATVKAHMTAIFRGLGVTNRAQALLALQPLLGEIGS